MVFVSFTATGRPVRPAEAAHPNPVMAAKRAMSCLFVNVRFLATGVGQVNLAENGQKRGLAGAQSSAINRPRSTGTPV